MGASPGTEAAPAWLRQAEALAALLLMAVAFGTVYASAQKLIPQPMVAALAVNLGLAVLALATGVGGPWAWPRDARAQAWAYGPALTVLGATVLATGLSGGLWRPHPWDAPYATHWLAWTLVPVSEEIVFRGALGGWFRRRAGPFWGAYWSALLFSVVHDGPRWEDVWAFRLSLPIGPLLLGLACEILLARSRSLVGPCLLHMACNMSGYLFYQLDPRWLEWLSALYR